MSIFRQSFIAFFTCLVFAACAQNDKKVDAQTFQKQISASKNAIVLDVRSEGEFQSGHLAKALNLNYNAEGFSTNVAQLDKNKTYFVYCAAGVRSSRAATIMRSQGFTNVIELKDGLKSWQMANLPLEK